MKKFLTISWIVIQVILFICLWVVLGISFFTQKEISEIINFEWWTFFFLLDLWTYKWINSAKSFRDIDETKSN